MGVTRGNLFGVVFIAVALTAVVLHRQVVPHLDAVGTSFPGYWVVAREIRAGTPAVKLYDDAWLAERMAAEGFPSDRMLGPPTLSLTALPVSGWEYPLARKIWLLGVLTPALLGSVAWLAAPLGLRAGAVFAGLVLESGNLLPVRPRTAFLLVLVWCGAVGGFAISTNYPLSAALLFIAGFVNLAYSAMAQTLVQLNAPAESRGRVIGLFNMSSLGLMTFSGISVGIGGSFIGIHWSLGLSAAGLAAVSIFLMTRAGMGTTSR